jgi:hypothetical protein
MTSQTGTGPRPGNGTSGFRKNGPCCAPGPGVVSTAVFRPDGSALAQAVRRGRPGEVVDHSASYRLVLPWYSLAYLAIVLLGGISG